MSGPGEHWIPPERFEAPRLVLRSWREGDGAALTEATEESHEHLAAWMPWATARQPVEVSEALVRRFRGTWLLRTDFVIAFFDPSEKRALGGSGFHLREGPLDAGQAEIGMWIRASEAGRGLGTEALRAVLEWGFTQWPWRRLTWRCDPLNEASARVAEKAGMRLEGTLKSQSRGVDGSLRDTACYALLKEEWQDARG